VRQASHRRGSREACQGDDAGATRERLEPAPAAGRLKAPERLKSRKAIPICREREEGSRALLHRPGSRRKTPFLARPGHEPRQGRRDKRGAPRFDKGQTGAAREGNHAG